MAGRLRPGVGVRAPIDQTAGSFVGRTREGSLDSTGNGASGCGEPDPRPRGFARWPRVTEPVVSEYPIDDDREAMLVSDEKDDITTAASELTHAVSGLLRAIDAVGDDGAAAKDIPDELPEELDRLVARLNAARGFDE